MYFDDDICYCADSDRCKNMDCFRNLCHHRRPQSGPDIFTCSHLMGTDMCPLTEEGED